MLAAARAQRVATGRLVIRTSHRLLLMGLRLPKAPFDSGQLAVCKTLEFKLERDMQPFECRSVRYWSKEINGTRTGG